MDVTATGMFIGIVAILLGIFGLMWQMNRQSSRLEHMIETQGKELDAKIDTQGKELNAKIDAQSKELNAKIETQGKELQAEIRAQGRRVSQVELDQARMNGVNSVLLQQTHTHERAGDAD